MSDMAPIVTQGEASRFKRALGPDAGVWLGRSASAWMILALCGQWIFATYVLIFYGSAVLADDWSRWNQVLPRGYVAGDTAGNLVVLSHLAFTVLVVLAATIQMLPIVRRHWPRIHRMSGRAFLVSALVLGLGGLIMSLFRGGSNDGIRQAAGVLNTLMIVIFAAMAWRMAMVRRFAVHRKWALRLFMAVAGVWFFRIGLMLWLVIFQAPVGFDPKTFTGPFLTFLSYAKFLLPLLFLEIYFAAEKSGSTAKWITSGTLAVLCLGTGVGIAGATVMLWLPHLK
ncbi:DUF2306 domain-containing protein [Pseudoxanthomonas sp. CF125]|uniref:DUF2306 domain-containing protein n=1 Tax=Pseudoxanthomonas sp. CF125 TaxID=1855303 RepID=UPI00088A9053|nr:DUF2306 domain-containing protein [Pseudoxanthomonas sp. CF125]SDQ81630.1 Predicted membrane protein [Pseudoxanthomonas sp. CF125]